MAHTGGAVRDLQQLQTVVRRRLAALGVVGLLGIAVLKTAAGAPEWLHASHVAIAVLLLAGALIVGRSLFAADRENVRDPGILVVQLVLLFCLLVVVYYSRTPGFVVGVHRGIETWLVFGGLLLFCVLAGDPREYTPVQWVVITCIAIVVGIFFSHSLSILEASTRSRHPVWSGTIMAVGVIVLPQYVSREQFCWAISRLAALVVIPTLPIYVLGEFSMWGVRFTFDEAFAIPLVELEVRSTRSLFVNRNTFATVVFAGLIAAVAEFHRAYERSHAGRSLVGPGVLLAIIGVGHVIAFGRTLWVLTPMVLGVYLAYARYGPRAIPVAVAGGLAYLVVGIAGVHSGLIPLPEDTPTRARRWYPALAAIADRPSLFGEGLNNVGQLLSEYRASGSAGSPHNSYLSIWIRTGIVGGVAYLALVVGSLLQGLRYENHVDVAVFVLAVGFAVHQVFEAYTLFGWWSSSVLATLAIGFLVFGSSSEEYSTAGDGPVDGRALPEGQPGANDR